MVPGMQRAGPGHAAPVLLRERSPSAGLLHRVGEVGEQRQPVAQAIGRQLGAALGLAVPFGREAAAAGAAAVAGVDGIKAAKGPALVWLARIRRSGTWSVESQCAA